MKTTTPTFEINATRANNDLAVAQARAEQIERFITLRLLTLEKNTEAINSFVAAVKGKNLSIGNMYSTGHSETEYSDDAQMIAHCTMELEKEYKNPKLAAERLQEKWKTLVPSEAISASFASYEIKGTEVRFKIWIKG